MRKPMALASTLVAAAAPVPALAKKHRHYPPGCQTKGCANRIGAIWAAHHPRARVSGFVAPYRAWLAKVRACESGGNYQTNTGNGFYGAYQFTISSWAAVGGSGLPSNAPAWEQDMRAVRLLKLQGPRAWPVCSQ